MALDAGSSTGPGYHNSPDFWDSKHITFPDGGVSDEFAWGHVYLRQYGFVGEPLRKAIEPNSYPSQLRSDDNDPAKHMETFIQDKLLDQNITDSMVQLSRGWARHNAEDRAGPLGLSWHFHAAYAPQNLGEIIEKWEKHRDVEDAVDKVLYVEVCWGGLVDTAFDEYGEPTGLYGAFPNMIGASTGDAQSDGLILLSMKAFRKKQQVIDTVTYEGGPVKSLQEIEDSRISEIQSKLNEDSLLNFTRADYEEADDLLETPGEPEWNRWWDYYLAAKAAAGE